MGGDKAKNGRGKVGAVECAIPDVPTTSDGEKDDIVVLSPDGSSPPDDVDEPKLANGFISAAELAKSGGEAGDCKVDDPKPAIARQPYVWLENPESYGGH